MRKFLAHSRRTTFYAENLTTTTVFSSCTTIIHWRSKVHNSLLPISEFVLNEKFQRNFSSSTNSEFVRSQFLELGFYKKIILLPRRHLLSTFSISNYLVGFFKELFPPTLQRGLLFFEECVNTSQICRKNARKKRLRWNLAKFRTYQ